MAFTREGFVVGVGGQPSTVFTRPLGVAGAAELRIRREDAGRWLNGYVHHMVYFPRRLEDDVLRRITG